jgi:hypothetical protein
VESSTQATESSASSSYQSSASLTDSTIESYSTSSKLSIFLTIRIRDCRVFNNGGGNIYEFFCAPRLLYHFYHYRNLRWKI